ncbi:TraR/DksA C4-type zinc finger protein [Planctomycetota bacterium]
MKVKKRKIKIKAEVKIRAKETSRKIRPSKIKTPFAKKALGRFKNLLLQHKEKLLTTVNQIEKKSLSSSNKEVSGGLSTLPIHLGDLGSDQYEQDFAIGVMEGERGEIAEINDALARIADKTYGICELCLKRIPAPRLNAVPYASLCIKCKEEEEKKTL